MALEDDKDERMEDVPKVFIDKTEKAQQDVYNKLIGLVSDFNTTAGNIDLSTENMAKIEQIGNEIIDVIFESEYGEGLIEYLREYDTQAALNAEIFKKNFGEFVNKDIYTNNLNTSRGLAIDLMGREGVDKSFVAPLKGILNDAVANGKSLKELIEDLELFVLGDKEQLGTLHSYISGLARDTFNIADRQYTRIVAEDIGAVWYFYTRGKVADTREFCIQRNGKYYHHNEISDWGHTPAQWQGRNKNTNDTTIFSYLGGYNCMHSVIPVDESRVPKSVIQRNKSKGNIN